MDNIQDKLMKLQNMELNYDRYQSDSLVLDRLYSTLLKQIPVSVIVSHLQNRNDFNKKWKVLQK